MRALMFLPLVLVPLLMLSLVAVLVYLRIHVKRPEILLQEWARDCGYRIAAWEERHLYKGPFFWSGRNAKVYYVTLEDAWGRRATAFIRCTGQLWGWPAQPVEVHWEADGHAEGNLRAMPGVSDRPVPPRMG